MIMKDGRVYKGEYCFNHRVLNKDGVYDYRQDEDNHFYETSETIGYVTKKYANCPSCYLRIEIR